MSAFPSQVLSEPAGWVSPEGSFISQDLRDLLEGLPEDELTALAAEAHLDPTALGDRQGLLEAIASLPNLADLLARRERRRLEDLLETLRPRQLREIAARHGLALHGLTKKSDLAAALVASPSAPALLMELEAKEDSEVRATRTTRDDVDELAVRIDGLLALARVHYEDRRFPDAMDVALEAARLAAAVADELRRSSWSYTVLSAQGILDACESDDPEIAAARDLLRQAKDRFAEGRLDDGAALDALVAAAHAVHGREAERLRQELAATRDAIRETTNAGASTPLAEDAWNRAAESMVRGDLREARVALARASQLATEARGRRIRELEASLSAVEDHIALARNVGANADEAEAHLTQAREAFARHDYGRASDFVLRAERLAMQGQQRQIEKAMDLQEAQTQRAYALIAANEPLVQEAESYGLNVAEARTLLRQARDVLTRGDYVFGLTFARNAEDAVARLQPMVAEERRRRGIQKPNQGICGVCQSMRLHFYDNGWGRCLNCGSSFRWRGSAGLWEALRGLLGT